MIIIIFHNTRLLITKCVHIFFNKVFLSNKKKTKGENSLKIGMHENSICFN